MLANALLIEPWFVLLAFLLACFVSALLHSSVGLGGGSSYLAWMVIFALPLPFIPILSLSLNVLVTSIGSVHFFRRGLIPWRLIGILLAFSVPASYVAAAFSLPETLMHTLLLLCLLGVLLRLCFPVTAPERTKALTVRDYFILAALGSVIGMLAGLVGIGGGIYLVPLLLILKLSSIQQAAACGSVFILCNSSVALLSKWQHHHLEIDVLPLLPIFCVVALGGFLGSRLAVSVAYRSLLQALLAVVIAWACVLLLWQLL